MSGTNLIYQSVLMLRKINIEPDDLRTRSPEPQ